MVIVKAKNLEQEAGRLLMETLREVPFLQRTRIRHEVKIGRAEADMLITFQVGRKERRLICEVKTNGQPRVARQACLNLRALASGNDSDYPVFVAPYISEDAAAICKEYGVGYFDLSGNCLLEFDHVYIRRQSYPNPSIRRRDLRSLYSPKAERILRVLVTAGPRPWKTQELAEEAKVSLGQVANIKKLLGDREWIDIDEKGLTMRSFENAISPLLNEWTSYYQFDRNTGLDLYSLKSVPEIEAGLTETAKKLSLMVGFTAFSGASRLAPAVRYQKATAYVLGDLELVAEVAGLKPVGSGANATLLRPYDEGLLYGLHEIDQAPIVSPVQLYLDLRQIKGRGEEAADALLEEVIRPQWR